MENVTLAFVCMSYKNAETNWIGYYYQLCSKIKWWRDDCMDKIETVSSIKF